MKKIKISILIAGLLFLFSQAPLYAEAIAPSSPAITHALSLGSAGAEVSSLQQFLKNLGYFTYPSITDYFGYLTKAAVVSFQKANNIDPIGAVGPLTRAKLRELSPSLAAEIISTTTPAIAKPIVRSGRIIHRDETAPTVPSDLNSSNVGQVSLILNWAASIDDNSVSGYRIERCANDGCTDFAEIGTSDTDSYSDSGLTADTLYRYRIAAVDSHDNVSAHSEIFDVTTLPVPTHSLSISKSGGGNGSIISAPAGISCGSTCTSSFTEGSTITLTATPSSGSTFTGWSGACSGTEACVIDITQDETVTASFDLATFALTIHKGGVGDGTIISIPSGINCGSTCTANYATGTIVSLSAFAIGDATFTGWSGGGCFGTGFCSVTIGADTTVTANFTMLSDA